MQLAPTGPAAIDPFTHLLQLWSPPHDLIPAGHRDPIEGPAPATGALYLSLLVSAH
jgi:hypothetical protein